MYESDLLVYKNTLTLTLKQNGALNRPLVLSVLSCHTLLPDIRNEMSKITLYCTGFDEECSSITKRCIS